jgi:hypothetical protein
LFLTNLSTPCGQFDVAALPTLHRPCQHSIGGFTCSEPCDLLMPLLHKCVRPVKCLRWLLCRLALIAQNVAFCARAVFLCSIPNVRVFENKMLKRTLGPKRDGVTGGWRKLHNEEVHNLYSSPSIIRII